MKIGLLHHLELMELLRIAVLRQWVRQRRLLGCLRPLNARRWAHVRARLGVGADAEEVLWIQLGIGVSTMALTCSWYASGLRFIRARCIMVTMLSNLLLIQMHSTPEAFILRGIGACALLCLSGYWPLLSRGQLRPRGKSVVDHKGLTATRAGMIISSHLATNRLISDAFLLLYVQHVHVAPWLLMLPSVQLLQERCILLIGSHSSSSVALLCTRENSWVALLKVSQALTIRSR
jgi:hypothetical protein